MFSDSFDTRLEYRRTSIYTTIWRCRSSRVVVVVTNILHLILQLLRDASIGIQHSSILMLFQLTVTVTVTVTEIVKANDSWNFGCNSKCKITGVEIKITQKN